MSLNSGGSPSTLAVPPRGTERRLAAKARAAAEESRADQRAAKAEIQGPREEAGAALERRRAGHWIARRIMSCLKTKEACTMRGLCCCNRSPATLWSSCKGHVRVACDASRVRAGSAQRQAARPCSARLGRRGEGLHPGPAHRYVLVPAWPGTSLRRVSNGLLNRYGENAPPTAGPGSLRRRSHSRWGSVRAEGD